MAERLINTPMQNLFWALEQMGPQRFHEYAMHNKQNFIDAEKDTLRDMYSEGYDDGEHGTKWQFDELYQHCIDFETLYAKKH